MYFLDLFGFFIIIIIKFRSRWKSTIFAIAYGRPIKSLNFPICRFFLKLRVWWDDFWRLKTDQWKDSSFSLCVFLSLFIYRSICSLSSISIFVFYLYLYIQSLSSYSNLYLYLASILSDLSYILNYIISHFLASIDSMLNKTKVLRSSVWLCCVPENLRVLHWSGGYPGGTVPSTKGRTHLRWSSEKKVTFD